MTRRPTRAIAALSALSALLAAGALALSACGLGSDGGTGDGAPASSSAPAATGAAPDASPDTASASSDAPRTTAPGTVDAAAVPPEWVDALALVDAARVERGLGKLRIDQGLTDLAQRQAEHYATGAQDWDGDFGGDLAVAGFARGSARIGSGTTPAEAVETWLASAEDAETLLDAELGFAGVGAAPWQGGQSVYLLVLAYRADDGSIPSGSEGAEEVLVLTNVERAKVGLAGVSLSDRLNAAAQLQADHQASILEMTHEGNGGLSNRVASVGYEARVAAENVAVGYPSIDDVVRGWIDSPGHYENIVNPDVTEMGFAVAFGSDGRAYYAQVLGDPF